ncbi:hypothetical protein NL676_039532 [Syzygium grande]|nr:hypothetical protein NL676_039532 [Syzygium grande]
MVGPGQQSKAESSKTTASFTQENGRASTAVADTEMQELNEDYMSTRESRLASLFKEYVCDDYMPSDDVAATKIVDVPGIERLSLSGNKEEGAEMKEQNTPDETENPEPNGAGGGSERVIVLDD